MFVLGITLRDKKDQEAVYPRVGPIYGYYEIGALIILLLTGGMMIYYNGLLSILFSNVSNEVIEALRIKLYVVGVIVILTIIHMAVSMMTINQVKSPIQKLLSKVSSMGIFLLNLVVLHYAMVLREIL